ncbi:MAG TPA: YceI family protein [Steroidobacteraceae bacterium]
MRKFLWPLMILLAGCAAPPQQPPVAPAPEAPPAAPALPFEAWTIVASHLEVRVFRDGPMQKLGHNHLITSDALEGAIELRDPLTKSGFDLRLPLESLVVDEPAARDAAGGDFANPVPAKDREATRHNMLGESVLDAASQAVLRLTADELSGEPGSYQARVRVAFRGGERVIPVPFTVDIEGGELHAHASFHLTHADIGLLPFTAGLGALRVRDDIEIDLRLEARRAS